MIEDRLIKFDIIDSYNGRSIASSVKLRDLEKTIVRLISDFPFDRSSVIIKSKRFGFQESSLSLFDNPHQDIYINKK